MNENVVIIGAGLGGLITAAILAKEGKNVTLIEKNANIGGGLQSFKRFGEMFDAGMHIIGGMNEGGNVYRICDYLGIRERMHYRPVDDDCMDELYFYEDKATYRIAKGREGFVSSLASYFPDQKENLTRYVEAMYNLTQEMDLFYLRPAANNIFDHSEEFLLPVKAFIEKYITDKKLQSVLAYMNPLYSGKADMTPAYIHSIINILYINGACRFEDGCQYFAELLRDFIEEHGGKVMLNDPVVKICTEGRMITSVLTQQGVTVTGDYYISSIHPCSMIKLLDDESVFPKSFRTRMNDIPNAYSAFSLYIKVKPETVRYVNHTRYFMSRYDEIWNFDKNDDVWPRGIIFVTPPETQQGEYSDKVIVTTPMCWEAVKQWEDTVLGKRDDSYTEWKERCKDRILCLLEEAMPGFSENIECVNTASPLTIRDYFNVKDGSMYGFAKDCDNIAMSQLPVVTKVRNLLLTGQNNNLHGFCGVSLTAINTCEVILGRDYIINKLNNK
ncbi:MAG: NAD(P)/FAD-dependent oxidoreductase [Prevotella sp.]|nr:NAD(P)/FAD-dependent oxidoreductase [Candidatus Prevotella equi]